MDSTNDVCEKHSASSSKLTIRTFAEDSRESSEQYVLLEGDAEALRFMAELILAHVNSDEGCNRFIHPKGPGSVHFNMESTVGIYLHKLPCDIESHKRITEQFQS
jgi:hypothetical protein